MGVGEAGSAKHDRTLLMGPNYSSSWGGNSVLIHCDKWAALGILQHHPTTAEAGNPKARFAPGGSRTSQVWPAPTHTMPPAFPARGQARRKCARGLLEDFPDWGRPRAQAACLLEAFRGFLAHRERESHPGPSGAFADHGGAAGVCGEPGLSATLSPAAHLRTREPLLTKQLQLPHL